MTSIEPSPSPADPSLPDHARAHLRRAERMAYVWYTLFAVAAIAGLTAIWPKYMARQERLHLNFEGREKAYEYRLEQRQKAIEEAEKAGGTVPSLSGPMWPVILAGASVALPLLALVVSLAVRRPHEPRGEEASQQQRK